MYFIISFFHVFHLLFHFLLKTYARTHLFHFFIFAFFHVFIPWGTAWVGAGVGASELWDAVCLGSAKLRALARLGFNGCKCGLAAEGGRPTFVIIRPQLRWPAASQVASRERPAADEGGGLGFTPLAFGWMHCGYDFLLGRRPGGPFPNLIHFFHFFHFLIF